MLQGQLARLSAFRPLGCGAAGPPADLAAESQSLTADYLSGRTEIAIPKERRPVKPPARDNHA